VTPRQVFILFAGLAAGACAGSDPNLSARSGAPSYGAAGALPPTLGSSSNDLTSRTWHWQRTQSDGGSVVASAPDRYTLTFLGGGRVAVRADCNRGSAPYEVNGTAMKVGPVALTRMGCPPGTQDAEFVQSLARVTSYSIADGELVLTLEAAGSMRLKAAQ